MGPKPGQVDAAEVHRAAHRPVDRGQDVEEGGLSSTVGSDQGVDGAGPDVEGDPVQCGHAGEPYGDTVDGECDGGVCSVHGDHFLSRSGTLPAVASSRSTAASVSRPRYKSRTWLSAVNSSADPDKVTTPTVSTEACLATDSAIAAFFSMSITVVACAFISRISLPS